MAPTHSLILDPPEIEPAPIPIGEDFQSCASRRSLTLGLDYGMDNKEKTPAVSVRRQML
jgi:hypothetical protein